MISGTKHEMIAGDGAVAIALMVRRLRWQAWQRLLAPSRLSSNRGLNLVKAGCLRLKGAMQYRARHWSRGARGEGGRGGEALTRVRVPAAMTSGGFRPAAGAGQLRNSRPRFSVEVLGVPGLIVLSKTVPVGVSCQNASVPLAPVFPGQTGGRVTLL